MYRVPASLQAGPHHHALGIACCPTDQDPISIVSRAGTFKGAQK